MHTKLTIVLVASWLAGLGGIAAAVAQTDDVAVVVSEKNPVGNLTKPELRRIFAGEKRSWAGGQPIRLFVRAPGAHERAVLLKLLDMSESEYKKYWAAQVFHCSPMECKKRLSQLFPALSLWSTSRMSSLV